jgi:hypothetical protein
MKFIVGNETYMAIFYLFVTFIKINYVEGKGNGGVEV